MQQRRYAQFHPASRNDSGIVDPLTEPTAFRIQVVAVLLEIAAPKFAPRLNKTAQYEAAVSCDRSASEGT